MAGRSASEIRQRCAITAKATASTFSFDTFGGALSGTNRSGGPRRCASSLIGAGKGEGCAPALGVFRTLATRRVAPRRCRALAARTGREQSALMTGFPNEQSRPSRRRTLDDTPFDTPRLKRGIFKGPKIGYNLAI